MWNRHKMFITHIGIPKHKRHLWLLSSGMKLYYLWVKRFFDIRRVIHNPSMMTFPPAARPRWAPKVNYLLRTLKLNSLTFLKSPKSPAYAFSAWHHSYPVVTFSVWDFYFDISEWHILPARAWTPVLMLHLTNPCAKQKVLSLTKPKGKIYKTKFFSHYITLMANLLSKNIIMTKPTLLKNSIDSI